MQTEFQDAATIRASLERLYHERAHLTNQLSTGEGEVKAAPIKLKDVTENIQSLEQRLKEIQSQAVHP